MTSEAAAASTITTPKITNTSIQLHRNRYNAKPRLHTMATIQTT
jgi:hypothetical protein